MNKQAKHGRFLWSPPGKPGAPDWTPAGRNPERRPPAKAGARVEGSNVCRVTRGAPRGARAFSRFEGVLLAASIALVSLIGFVVHRWLWTQADLFACRSTMQALTSTVRTMRAQALAQRRTVQLHVDAAHGVFRMGAIQGTVQPYETSGRTIWLPQALRIAEAPEVLTALPTGSLSCSSIVITAPAHNKVFRVTTNTDGRVQLHEEPTL